MTTEDEAAELEAIRRRLFGENDTDDTDDADDTEDPPKDENTEFARELFS